MDFDMSDRSKHIGSSDIAAVIGISPFKTAMQLYEEKLGISEPEYNPEKEIRLKRGTRFEPLIVAQYEEEYYAEIVAKNVRYTHPEYEFLAAEIDAEQDMTGGMRLGEIMNVEIKSASSFMSKKFGEQGTDDIPDYYAAQVTYGMLCTGRKNARLVVLLGTDDLRTYDIPYDEDLGSYLEQEAVNFWNNHILAKVPPMPQSKEDSRHVLDKFPGFKWTVDEHALVTIDLIKQCKLEIKKQEDLKDRHEMELFKGMAIAAEIAGGTDDEKFIMVDDSGKQLASWNQQDHTSLDQKRLKSEYPEIAESLTRKQQIRVLRIK
jgi:putative phage-type endonuclease